MGWTRMRSLLRARSSFARQSAATRPSTPRPWSTSSFNSPFEENIMKKLGLAVALIVFPLAAEDSASAVDHLLDRIVERESALIDVLQSHTPVVETYIQEM